MKKVKLKDVAEIIYGYPFDSKQFNTSRDGVKLIRIRDIKDGDSATYTTESNIAEKYYINNGDILLGMDGDFNISIWKGGFAYLNQRVCKLKSNTMLEKYLFYSLKLKLKEIEDKTAFVTVKHLSAKVLENIEIEDISLSEQEKIVNILDTLTQTIANEHQQLQKFELLIKSQFIEMFGNVNTNNKNWDHELIGNAFNVSSGGTPSTTKEEYWKNGNISWIGSNLCQNIVLYQNDGKYITQKGFDNSSAKLFKVNTVLVALVGATIGKTALLKFETTTNQNIAGIDVYNNDNYTPEYVYYSLQQMYNKFLEIGSGKFKMANLSFVRNLDIPTPPIELQNQFADFVKHIDKLKFTLKQRLEKLENCYISLMHEYFE